MSGSIKHRERKMLFQTLNYMGKRFNVQRDLETGLGPKIGLQNYKEP